MKNKEFFTFPTGLNPNTVNLVARFASAMAAKLAKAERKYGYSDGWASSDWMDECRQQLHHHLAKGDPLDVSNYAAFLWHHGESTAMTKPVTPAGGEVGNLISLLEDVAVQHEGLESYGDSCGPSMCIRACRGAIAALSNPPVADAAPPKLGLSADEVLHIASELPAKWRRWADGLRGIQAANRIRDCADDLDAALNQRGGG